MEYWNPERVTSLQAGLALPIAEIIGLAPAEVHYSATGVWRALVPSGMLGCAKRKKNTAKGSLIVTPLFQCLKRNKTTRINHGNVCTLWEIFDIASHQTLSTDMNRRIILDCILKI